MYTREDLRMFIGIMVMLEYITRFKCLTLNLFKLVLVFIGTYYSELIIPISSEHV